MSKPVLNDAGGVRVLLARWIVTAELVTASACRFGGEPSGSIDMPILRRPFGDAPLLPGSTIAGALRNYLTDRLEGYYSSEPGAVERLFGEFKNIFTESHRGQSPLVVFDSYGILEQPAEIRDGVAINPERGIAEEHKKYDMEAVPAGTRFPIHFELVICRGDDEPHLLELLKIALEGFDLGDLSLGCRRSRGFGRIKAHNWQARRYDLTTEDGWLKWLSLDPAQSSRTEVGEETFEEIFAALCISSSARNPDRRQQVVLDLVVDLKASMLIRSGGTHADDPDAVQLTSAGRTVLSGTSLTGALRARTRRIARLLRPADADKMIDHLFGPRDRSKRPACSRLRISEEFLVEDGGLEAERIRTSRIRIDRFTQGIFPGALFEEETQSGGRFRVRMELRNISKCETGLLLMAVKDLLTGFLPIGSGSSIGRGFAQGTMMVSLFDGRKFDLWPATDNLEAVRWCEEMIGSILAAASENGGN